MTAAPHPGDQPFATRLVSLPVPPPSGFTTADLPQLMEIIGGRFELRDGDIVMMATPTHWHDEVAHYLRSALRGVAPREFVVANEKGVPRGVIFDALEAALASAAKRKHGGDILTRVSINRVTGFLGPQGKPMPMRDAEVNAILNRVEEGLEAPRNLIRFDIGETVQVTDGPFEGFAGMVEDVDEAHSRLKVTVSIFGRATPVELEFTQVSKGV